jgi:hypothetical protein
MCGNSSTEGLLSAGFARNPTVKRPKHNPLEQWRYCSMNTHERGVRYMTEQADSSAPLARVRSPQAQDSGFYLEYDGSLESPARPPARGSANLRMAAPITVGRAPGIGIVGGKLQVRRRSYRRYHTQFKPGYPITPSRRPDSLRCRLLNDTKHGPPARCKSVGVPAINWCFLGSDRPNGAAP